MSSLSVQKSDQVIILENNECLYKALEGEQNHDGITQTVGPNVLLVWCRLSSGEVPIIIKTLE